MKKLKTVAFLARWPGLLVLRELRENPLIDLRAVYTHGLLPKAEGQGRRPELYHFEQECGKDVPLYLTDIPSTPGVGPVDLDLIIALSWRYYINHIFIERAKTAINIHRGDLPKYAGAEPVRRALEAGEKRFAITAHHMTEEIDAGRPIAVVWTDPPILEAGAIRDHLVPLYVPLVRLAIEAVAR